MFSNSSLLPDPDNFFSPRKMWVCISGIICILKFACKTCHSLERSETDLWFKLLLTSLPTTHQTYAKSTLFIPCHSLLLAMGIALSHFKLTELLSKNCVGRKKLAASERIRCRTDQNVSGTEIKISVRHVAPTTQTHLPQQPLESTLESHT